MLYLGGVFKGNHVDYALLNTYKAAAGGAGRGFHVNLIFRVSIFFELLYKQGDHLIPRREGIAM
jgi:hypothetical protein